MRSARCGRSRRVVRSPTSAAVSSTCAAGRGAARRPRQPATGLAERGRGLEPGDDARTAVEAESGQPEGDRAEETTQTGSPPSTIVRISPRAPAAASGAPFPPARRRGWSRNLTTTVIAR